MLFSFVLAGLFARSTLGAALEAKACTTIDTAQHCGQWDTINTGPYTLYLDQWVGVMITCRVS
jgi:hypothetical protein